MSSSGTGNGIDGFIQAPSHARVFRKCVTLANSGSVGSAFYHPYAFVASDHVTALKRDGLNSHTYIFMLPPLARIAERYNFQREINDLRLKRERVRLPSTAQGEPDFGYMDEYMRRIATEMQTAALGYFHKRLKNNDKICTLAPLKLAPFPLGTLVSIANGERLTQADSIAGDTPFVGASELNNGITGWVGNCNASLDSQVLGVNYNGSVCRGFYHPYPALFSDDVKRVRWRNATANNRYSLMYLAVAIWQQRGKYAYGYKFNTRRMQRQMVLLPVASDGQPDYSYMEAYMRGVEAGMLAQYVQGEGDVGSK